MDDSNMLKISVVPLGNGISTRTEDELLLNSRGAIDK